MTDPCEVQVGTGKLYRFGYNQFLTEVKYHVFEHPAATNWWGELVPMQSVSLNEGELFALEFEDHRRSQCHLQKKVNRAVSGFPPRYVYHVTGFSAIE
jgi:hypothetical protein